LHALRKQKTFLHQTTVTDIQYGVFVTAIAANDESQVLQYIIITFIQEEKGQHLSRVDSVGKDLVGCLRQDILLNYG